MPQSSDFTPGLLALRSMRIHVAVLYMLHLEGSNGLHHPVVKPSLVERYFWRVSMGACCAG
eukprot:384847-Amphidinium_carterae.1